MTKHKSNETSVIERRALDALDLDLDAELQAMMEGIETQPPRVRIEHSSSGKHRIYIDLGESYDPDEETQINLPGNELKGIVCYSQFIRALWVEGEAVPRCAAIGSIPTVIEPVHHNCKSCPQGQIGKGLCKAKVRLLVLANVDDKPTLLVFALSPTSIKRWRSHVSRLARSKAPYISVVTRFSLEDMKKNSFRWAEVEMDVDRVVSEEELNAAVSIRDQFKSNLRDVSEEDYSDPGDKQPF